MSKTPEQMAKEYGDYFMPGEDNKAYTPLIKEIAWLAGYQAARDTYKDAISAYEDVAKQMLEEAVRIISPKDQLADTGKMMNSPEKPDSWISVKERLPEHNIPVLVFDTLANTIELMSWDKIMEAFGTEDAYFVELNEASHWMPLPELPEKK